MFQGADVSGLDAMANKAQEGADLARTVATALKILVRALEAMSWTGFAAAFAAYLETVVIPWVETTGKALERFATILRAASALQKSVSEDSPQISVPASAYTPVQMPASTSANPPLLTAPEYAITGSAMPTTATGVGGSVATPSPVGGTQSSLGQSAATGGGGNVTSPGGVGRTWDGTGSLGQATGTPAVQMSIENATITIGTAQLGSGGGSTGQPAHVVTPVVPAALTAGSGALGAAGPGGAPVGDPGSTAAPGASFGLTGSHSTDPGAPSGTSTFDRATGVGGTSLGSTGVGGTSLGSSGVGGGSVGGTTEAPSAGSGAVGSGPGSLGGAAGGGAGSGATGGLGAAGRSTGQNLPPGDPVTMSTPIPASTGSLGATAQASPALLGEGGTTGGTTGGGGARAAMAAAPLGLAGAGAAALGGLRGARKDAGEEADDS